MKMDASKAVKKAIEKAGKATKKVFPQKRKPTKRELLLDIHKKLDKMVANNEEALRKIGGSS
jgi:hypothetical protein